MTKSTCLRSLQVVVTLLILFMGVIFRQVKAQSAVCNESPVTQCERVMRSIVIEANSIEGLRLRSRCPEYVQAAQCVEDYYDNCVFDIFRPIGGLVLGGYKTLIQFICQGIAPVPPAAQPAAIPPFSPPEETTTTASTTTSSSTTTTTTGTTTTTQTTSTTEGS